jgi:hypothetical protein
MSSSGTGPERLALARFLSGYTGLTRVAYTLDLREFAGWCRNHAIRLFAGCPAGIGRACAGVRARG